MLNVICIWSRYKQPQKFLYTKISIATFYFCVVSQQSIARFAALILYNLI